MNQPTQRDPAAMQKALATLDSAASQLSKLGLDNETVSEVFFAYSIRLGVLVAGAGVFDRARQVIDSMERQSSGG